MLAVSTNLAPISCGRVCGTVIVDHAPVFGACVCAAELFGS